MNKPGFKRITLHPAFLPEGTNLIPASSIEEGAEGWVLLPPEEAMESRESFDAWKDELINNALEVGLKNEQNKS